MAKKRIPVEIGTGTDIRGADCRAALKEIEALRAARAGTPEGERLDLFRTFP